MPSYLFTLQVTTIANNVVISYCTTVLPWSVSVCECSVGDKTVPGEEHSQITILIQQGQTIYGGG